MQDHLKLQFVYKWTKKCNKKWQLSQKIEIIFNDLSRSCAVRPLINSINTKIRPNYKTEMWQIRVSATYVNTHELLVNHSENIYTIIQNAVFYYNPMIPPLSVSGL